MFKEVSITKLKISKLKCVYVISLILLNTINVPLLNFSGWPVNNNFQMLLSIFLLYKLFIKEENKINENYFKFFIITALFLFVFNFIKYENSYYQSCYKTDLTSFSNFDNIFINNNECQFSFDNLRNNYTRKNYKINHYSVSQDLGTGIEFTNWNLHFFNQTGFNFYDKEFYSGSSDSSISYWWGVDTFDNPIGPLTLSEYQQGIEDKSIKKFNYGFGLNEVQKEPSRSWLPFSLEIYNNSKTNHDNLIIFKYVGELSVRIDEDIYNFQNKYSSIGEVELFIPANKQVTINYIYRYSAPIGNHPGAPYATLQILDKNYEPVNIYERNLLSFDEMLIFLLFVILIFTAFMYDTQKKEAQFLLFFGVLFLAIFYLFPDRVQGLAFFILSIFGYIFLINKKIPKNTFLTLTIFLNLTFLNVFNNFNSTKYTYGGGDALKYESWAQEIILQKSLRAGEDIFFYMPGYRYLLSILRSLFGDTHSNIVLLYSVVVLFLIFKLLENKSIFDNNYFYKFIFSISIYVVMFSFSVMSNVLESYSEWPTWLILLTFICFFKKTDNKKLLLIPFLLFFFRPNQLGGALFILLILLFSSYKKFQWKDFVLPILLSIFPFVHNLYYGGVFTFNKDPLESGSYYITPMELFNHLFLIEKSEMVIFHLNYLFGNRFNESVYILGGPIFITLINVFLILFVFSAIFLILKRKLTLISFLEHSAVGGFLLVHLIYQVHTYYPRHIVVGYIMLIFVTINNLSTLKKTDYIENTLEKFKF